RTPNTRACMTSATQRCLHREGTIRMREGTDPAAYGQQAMIGAVRTLRLTPHPSSCQPAFIGGFSLGGSLTSSSSGCGTSAGLGPGTSGPGGSLVRSAMVVPFYFGTVLAGAIRVPDAGCPGPFLSPG